MRISDWSSDVCSSDLLICRAGGAQPLQQRRPHGFAQHQVDIGQGGGQAEIDQRSHPEGLGRGLTDAAGDDAVVMAEIRFHIETETVEGDPVADPHADGGDLVLAAGALGGAAVRSEEHTSELQSLMRISYAVLCLTNNKSTHFYQY